jgi:hypothetical protein
VFRKTRALLEDESAQNDLYLPEVSAVIRNGSSVDRIPGATGDFGRLPSNPIPVNGVLGELIYLSSLMTAHGARLVGHRVASIAHVDVFEVASVDMRVWDVLCFDPYHPRKSRHAPSGLRLETNQWILATNYRLDAFPVGIRDGVSGSTREFIGLPIVAPLLNDGRWAEFRRPEDHAEKVRMIEAEFRK